jgi:hypothetical protein
MYKRQVRYLLLLGLILTVISCATFQQNSYKTIAVAGYGYDAAMKTAADLDKQGKLTSEQKAIILTYGNKYWASYNASIDAMNVYITISTVENENRVLEAIEKVINNLGNLTSYISIIRGGE